MKNGLFITLVAYFISSFFTFVVYFLLTDYFGIELTQFPGILLGIYLCLAWALFPQVVLTLPYDSEAGYFVTSKILYPVYFLISPILFFYWHFKRIL
ncbi:hypothetical protein [Aerococcus sp. Group 1]|uniref:hypothetical protein n=1 Tax=Aerococcus urinae (strain CCUG 59500 / ACS-120-V-Col10a) TaxID=2976812 RepID=UPI000200E7E1|nr:hypothetical protein [Aerococcus sp. Group 1]AEA00304.1 hypothetical protein HMPREF9243_1895 [Aerococcus sp. Group 1]MCY3030370.1 hypothetical protein [Aerococcus sp. Group 1]MCY3054878.1 hypothetical protein [Aerococcus sp. Group 1]MCY3056608.1 hypothetical protein [Aerococcus sp. Group 1]MCY3061810.1 hypothetical protein [Aerococcus sp. Group 1]